ncbi:MAG: phosphodiesterase [Pseudomonadota bacterium]
MKSIHLTDTHVEGAGLLYGQDPVARLAAAVQSINAEHDDAALVVVTGDLSHWGDADAYARFAAEITALQMSVHLMMGNHDDRAAFGDAFDAAPHRFVQTGFDTPLGRFLLLDTKADTGHAGAFCAARRDWLTAELARADGPVLLFMHHPPFPVGIAAMDAIMPGDAAAFFHIVDPHRARIRHLFFGHVYRAIFGSWRGISYSCMRGLNHQVALDPEAPPDRIAGDFEPPAYGVALPGPNQTTVHLHDFTDPAERFAV